MVRIPLSEAIFDDNIDEINRLISNHEIEELDVEDLEYNKDGIGYPPILIAAYHDRFDIVELLISKGFDLKYVYREVIYYLIMYNRFDQLKHFISLNIDDIFEELSVIEENDIVTLIYAAIRYRRIDIIDYLLSIGFHIDNRTLILLCKNKQYESIKLISKNYQFTPPDNIFRYCDQYLTSMLCNAGIPPKISPYIRNWKVIKLLLSHGADINEVDSDGFTLLNSSAYQNHSKLMRKLISHGANVNIENDNYKSPLYYMIKHHNLKMGRFLLRHGANPSSLLCVAINYNNLKFFQLLIEFGAKVDYITYEYACKRGSEKFVKLILSEHYQPSFNFIDGNINNVKLLLSDCRIKVNDIKLGYPFNHYDEFKTIPLLFHNELDEIDFYSC
jgi:ankyrin repeat protein